MLYDGINLTSGSSVFNLEIENVATLPAAVADGLGRMVYLTSAYSTYSVGPYVNDGTIWQPIQTSASAGVSTVGDSYFDRVSLLMHAEGANGSTTFIDSSSANRTVTSAGGTPTISTAQQKFGASSLNFPNTGTAMYSASGLQIAGADTAGGPFDFSTGDFTVEMFIRPAANQTTRLLIGTANALTGTGGWGIRLDTSSLVLLGNGNGQGSVSWSWTADTWYHLALCRSGSTTKIFINGSQVGGNLTPSFGAATNGALFIAGGHPTDGYSASYSFNGFMDEIRITKGVARYTTNFTAPTTAFLNQAALVNGVYTNATITNTGSANYPTLSVASAYTPYDVSSCVIGKPDAAAVVAYIVSPRAFNIPNGYTASVAKSAASATSSAVFTVNKNGSSIGTFTFSAGGTTAAWSGTGGSIVAGDVISIVAPATQDATLANIAFTIAGNLQ